MRTPPSASTTSTTPSIFTTMWLVTGTPVSACTAVMAQAAAYVRSSSAPPPIVNALLNMP